MPRPLTVAPLLLTLAAASLAQDAVYRTPPDRPIDVTHIDLRLAVDLEQRSVEGEARIDLTLQRAVDGFTLNAVDHEVLSVGLLDGASLKYAHDGEELRVELGEEHPRGTELALAIRYRLRDPRSGLHFYGPTPGAPEVPLQVWSQGEPEHNRYWFPCVDHPLERQTTAMSVEVERGLTVISNGSLVSKEDTEGGTTLWRYEQEQEHVAYLVSLVVGRFDVERDEWRGKPLGYYVPVGRKADIPRSFARTKDMLDFFSDAIGVEYPWPKYDQVVVEQFGWGGMENTGATTLNERTLHDERAHIDYSSEGLVAHELAHQWFGDLITCQDWSHIWLNESFATYFAALWTEHSMGRDEFDNDVLQMADRGRRSGAKRAIVDRHYPHADSMFDGRAYPKGGTVLHMLRRELGDETWWAGIRLYAKRHRGQSAETALLRRAFEEVSGRNLERFFHDWVHRPGVPKLDVKLKHDAERDLLEVRIGQIQDGDPYRFTADLALGFGEGETQPYSFLVDEKESLFLIPAAEAPNRFRFDPEGKVILAELKVHKSRELWLRQLREDDAMGRLLAARALAEDRRPEVADALARALAEDPFWAVRVGCAEALGKFDDQHEPLLAGLAQDDPDVREACAEALGKQGPNEALAAAVAKLLRDDDPSYYVQAEAVSAYRKLAEDPRELLLAQLRKDSHNEVIRTSALRALGQLGDASLVPVFVEHLHPRHHEYVRHTAARSLAVAALPGTSEEHRLAAVTALREFLAATGRRGRRAALDGLHALAAKAPEALTLVEACAENDPDDRLRDRAKEVAERIRTKAEPDAELARLREEIRRLRGSMEELQERLDREDAIVEPAEGAGGK